MILEQILDWRPFDYLTEKTKFFEHGPTAVQTIELEPTTVGTRVHFRLVPPRKAADRVTLAAMAGDLEAALVASLSALSSHVEGEARALVNSAAEPPLPQAKSNDGFLAGVQPIEFVA